MKMMKIDKQINSITKLINLLKHTSSALGGMSVSASWAESTEN